MVKSIMNKGIKLILMLQWLSMLSYTDSYFAVYVVVFAASFYCFIKSDRSRTDGVTDSSKGKPERSVNLLFSLLLSMFVVFSNYRIWTENLIKDDYTGMTRNLYVMIMLIMISVGSFVVFDNIFGFIYENAGRLHIETTEKLGNNKSHRVFLTLFAGIIFVDLLVMFTCMYPGVIISDSIDQIGQIMSGVYSNHHPFYQTILIKPFVMAGISLFGNINTGVAMYTVFQVILMAAIISFAAMTLYECGIAKKVIYVVSLVYMFMPYHLMFSFNIWKDTIFGGCVLLYAVVCCRLMKRVGQEALNYWLLGFSGIGICLFRSNGFIAFAAAVAAFMVIFRLKDKKAIVIMIGIAAVSIILRKPILNMLNVSHVDFIESLSVPIQQVARVIVDGEEASDDDLRMISRLGDPEEIRDRFDIQVSDPEKNYLRSNGADDVLKADKTGYLKMYLSIGKNHPWTYAKAWIDQTKGYWNGGYPYWVWAYTVDQNELGLERTTFIGPMLTLVRSYCSAFYNIPILQVFLSIGLHVWLLLVVLFISIVKRDKVCAYMTILPLAIVGTLVIATPVFNEFRYAYAIFCVLPFALPVTSISPPDS